MSFLRTSILATFFIAVLTACGGSSPPPAPAGPPPGPEASAPAEPPVPIEIDVVEEPQAAGAPAGDQACGGCPHCDEKGTEESAGGEAGECGQCGKKGKCRKKAQMMELCKAIMGQADLTVRNTADGVALVFVARDAAKVGAVRADAEKLAELHEKMNDGKHHGKSKHGKSKHGKSKHGMMKIPRVNVALNYSNGGAELVLTPQDPAKLADLREHVAEHAKMMTEGNCEMPDKDQPAPPGD